MKSSHQIELTAGIFLLLAIAALVFLALQATDRGVASGDGYRIEASFINVGGLKPRAKVALGGVTIGQVESISLDPESFEALVVMRIAAQFDDLPEDSSASILTSGILGDQFVGIEPGGSPEPLVDGDRLMLTNSALQLEQLISRYLFNSEEEE
ncbi:outer membrane lipid asymmetry maintenance protein MlaD [Wenzhouxiangella marina]|uniref:ABC-type transport system involved in resistance to organic solvents periplasmic component n=1 Tax=Wenzhouxiangella marina TaxID=1579979 RepID=A0A0K0XX85_9GAMM|nr:outer membrane lipid asymmetry maintenance protein MlaD [Wenzhouxiangella marina]AKS42309.1 ABC-type transport system involved in resistance to organic solvents periplasmic component [Wenzhouxiangella marina]MBB6085918.1 phospholipid/cholesterol/gamma-HCH transport system substrate-binding protein [Wenzhouxiangella marina]